MAQTTNQVSIACGQLEISTDGSAWTDISGEAQSISQPEQTRMTGEAYTLDGDYALPGGGKRQPMEITATIIYTEVDAEAYQVTRNRFELTSSCGENFWIRYSPAGGSAGDERITSGPGYLISFLYPNMDASAGGVITCGFTVKVGYVTTAVIAS